jgi:glycosyltransferase involved in cell wall biosynthesis
MSPNPKPVVSVIIPAHNEEKYLPKCLESLEKQIFKLPFETIVVDNNSKDKTSIIAKDYKVKLIFEPRQGVTIAKNAGAKNAISDIFIFLDADCIAPTQYLENIYTFLTDPPKVSAIGGPYVFIDGGPLVYFITKKLKYLYFFLSATKLFFGYQVLTGGNMVVKREAFQKINGFNENITNIIDPEDVDFSVRLQKKGFKVVLKNEIFVFSSFRRQKITNIKQACRRFSNAIGLLQSKK